MRWRFGVLVSGLLLSSAAADAEPARAALAAGGWGLHSQEPHELGLQLEIRPGVRWWWVRPTVGLLQSTEGTQVWFAGFLLEIPIAWGVTLSPGLAPGIRTLNGKRNLGSALLFKSSVELAAPLTPGLRVLMSFAHVSNGKLATPNPGIEMLLLGFEVDLE